MKRGAGLIGHKSKRETPRRILDAALMLFNRYGEPSVTATSIAADIGISHGNLQYHYPSKEKIVEDLFAEFRREIGHTLNAPETRSVHAEDVWLFLHLTFETILKYRFLYRNLNELLSRHRIIETQFRNILSRQTSTASALLRGLAESGAMHATEAQCNALAESMIMIATYWLSYEFVLNPRRQPDNGTLTRGIVGALFLASPYLAPEARALFDHLSQQYLKPGGDEQCQPSS